MSYLVLARKYRPKTFAQLVGQSHVVQALSNALEQQRLHHAYLFTGTRGVGKTTVSRILAKSLNCEKGITSEPCGACEMCLAIDAGRFVDYTELDAASNRGVDEVQQLLEQAVYKPVQGRFKVFMIDEVHMLSGTAFNAMLKTLEEPPEYLKFVLATTDPQKVPVTVLSRCLQFNLRPMAAQTIREHLGTVLQSEAIECEPQALHWIARAARGSMRDALSLTDQSIAYGAGAVREAEVRQMLGSVDREHVFALIAALGASDGPAVIALAEQLQSQGLSASQALEDMAFVLQRMAVMQFSGTGASSAAHEVDPDALSDQDEHRTRALASVLPKDETQLLYSICIKGRAEIGLAPDEYSGLTMVLLRLLAFKPQSTSASEQDLAEKKTLEFPSPELVPSGKTAFAQAPSAAQAGDPSRVQASPQRLEASPHVPSRVRAEPTPEPTPNSSPVAHLKASPAEHERTAMGSKSSTPPSWGAASTAQSHPGRDLPVRDMGQRGGVSRQSNAVAHDTAHDNTHAHEGLMAVAVRVAPQNADKVNPQALERFKTHLKPTALGDEWMQTVQQLMDADLVQSLSRELALQSQLVAKDEHSILLRIESETLSSPNSRERLTLALANLGMTVELRLEMGAVSDSAAMRLAQVAYEKQVLAEAKILGDPFVQKMMQEFEATIVPGSIKTVLGSKEKMLD
jgi:DNA polymerase-3 subunit gamma/tau